jgi:hypothetical protein
MNKFPRPHVKNINTSPPHIKFAVLASMDTPLEEEFDRFDCWNGITFPKDQTQVEIHVLQTSPRWKQNQILNFGDKNTWVVWRRRTALA